MVYAVKSGCQPFMEPSVAPSIYRFIIQFFLIPAPYLSTGFTLETGYRFRLFPPVRMPDQSLLSPENG
jgi:hypothetical protein